MKIISVAKLFCLRSPLFFLVAACMALSCVRTDTVTSKAGFRRTVPPLAESTHASIAELNVRKAPLNGGRSRREKVSSTEVQW